MQTVWLVGAGLLLAVLAVGGGWLVVRGIGTPDTAAPVETSPANTTADGSGFEVAELVEGVPWGFALDRPGAASAALAVVGVTGQAEFAFDPERFTQIAKAMFTPAEAELQARQVETARTNFELSGWAEQPASRRMYHLSPLAVRVTAFDPQALTASVEVWAMTLVGVGDNGGAVFTTSTVELVADDTTGTWRVTTLDTVEGPVPMVYDSPSAPGRTRAMVRDAAPVLPLPLPDFALVEPTS
ncbi:hypothetical protein [Egicoccus sp. AB-alg6-2]|uniref:hypothetical protein n=1 Tax=Egicoccus sp. AB-alg6-2 TaxID=3242692 RepID=UPI00359DE66F